MPEDGDFGRVVGMLLDLAIGDALGNATSRSFRKLASNYPVEIRGYLPNQYYSNRKDGVPRKFTTQSKLASENS